SRHGNFVGDDINLPGRNRARCRAEIGLAHQAIHDPGSAVFLGIISLHGLREMEDFVHVWPAQVAVYKENAITLWRDCERIIGTGETFSLVGKSTGKK